jgi:hypothetical protein
MLSISKHSRHWGSIRAGKCWEYVWNSKNIPTIIQSGKSLDYWLYFSKYSSNYPTLNMSGIFG